MNKVTPFLWFDNQAEQAANLYVSLFPNSKIMSVSPMIVEFTINKLKVTAMNGGNHYKLTPAFSFSVECETQEEVDKYWDSLIKDGGAPSQCGWLVDKFGLSWQIVPRQLIEIFKGEDKERAARAMQVMMPMQKLDINALIKA